jgi:hypothetical protein
MHSLLSLRRRAGIEHPVSDIRQQDGNRPILTFCDILGHFHAIMQCILSKKSGAYVKNGLTNTGATPD